MVRDKLCLGIDIGASSIKLCQLNRTRHALTLERYGVMPLPSDTIVDGSLMNSARIVESLRELVRTHKVRNRRVALSISGHAVIIKKISLPRMTRKELEISMQWEAAQFIPFDIKDVYLDVQIVGPESQDQGQMDVVLVAAKRDFVNDYTSVLQEAGLEPVICDVDAFAVETVYTANYGPSLDKTIALVHVGASKTSINILAGGISSFTRDLTLGGYQFTEELKKTLHLSQEEAEELKLGTLEGERGQSLASGAEATLAQVAQSLTGDIQRSLDFHTASSGDPAPSILYLSGGSARMPALADALRQRLQIEVDILEPFRRLEAPGFDAEFLRAAGPAAAIAVGLALRYPGDA